MNPSSPATGNYLNSLHALWAANKTLTGKHFGQESCFLASSPRPWRLALSLSKGYYESNDLNKTYVKMVYYEGTVSYVRGRFCCSIMIKPFDRQKELTMTRKLNITSILAIKHRMCVDGDNMLEYHLANNYLYCGCLMTTWART